MLLCCDRFSSRNLFSLTHTLFGRGFTRCGSLRYDGQLAQS
jgi:hypothetical protein